MGDSLGMQISKLVIREEPQLLVNDMGANARACLALSEVLGSLLAALKVKKGQAYYQEAVRAILERVDETAKGVHQRAVHIAENEPEMQGRQ